MARFFTLFSVLLLLCGCSKREDTYAPPIDRRPMTGPVGDATKQIADMGAPDAETYIVGGISPGIPRTPWRWAYKRPELRFVLYDTVNRKFFADFAIPETTFRDTGPVTVSFFINNHLLDQVHCDTPGSKHFEKPVPSEWMKGSIVVNVAAEIDKVWTATEDGAKLGFILIRAGFTD